MDISVTIHSFELKFSVCNPNILPDGRLSQNSELGPSFYFMSKSGPNQNFETRFPASISHKYMFKVWKLDME